MTELKAFRVYGEFVWPTPHKPTVTGCIEFFYIPAGGGQLAACFRWTPKEFMSSNVRAPAALERLVQLGDQGLADRLRDPTQIIALRLDDDPQAPTPPTRWPFPIVFRGGALFEQYEFAVSGDKNDAVLQWPLARAFNRGKGSKADLRNSVVLGDADDKAAPDRKGASYAFQLALYTPGAQANHDANGGEGTAFPSYAFPFRARYRPVLARTPAEQKMVLPVRVDWLAAGAAEDSFQDDEVDFEKEWVGKKVQLANPWLGGFGFSRTDGGDDNLYIPRDGRRRDRFWPSHGPTFVSDLLLRFAGVDRKLGDQIEVRADFAPPGPSNPNRYEITQRGQLRNSIRFRRSGTRSIILYRSSMRLTDSATNLGLDIGVRNGRFDLADPYMAGARLPTSSDAVLIEVELEYEISDLQHIWAFVANRAALKPEMRLRVGVGAEIDNEPGNERMDTERPATSPFSMQERLAEAINGFRLSRLGLRALEPLHAQSMLPEVEIADPGKYRLALCAVMDASFSSKKNGLAGIVDCLEWRPKGGQSGEWPRFRLTGWPDRPAHSVPGVTPIGPLYGEAGKLAATFRLPSFAYRNKPDEDSPVRVWLGYDDKWDSSDHHCSFRIDPGGSAASISGRLGGIEFTSSGGEVLNADEEADRDYSYWRFSLAPPIAIRREGDQSKIPPPQSFFAPSSSELRLRLAIARISPLGSDLARTDRDPAALPLLIPENDAGGGTGGQFILDTTETLGPDYDRRLTATILDTGKGDASSGQYVLLSERPFSVTRVLSKPLQERGSQENTQVAEYDSDTGTWSFKLVTPTYQYVLPPQAIGESMDKPRRLEIHDPDPNLTPAPALRFTRPYPSGVNGEPVEADGVVRRHIVDFRLTPSAELWIRPSDVERGYYLPEWETERLFGSKGAYGLGVAMAAFRGEFIYGLPVGVDTDLESGAARGARVAEIGAMLGQPPAALPASSAREKREAWDRRRDVLARRPERLEVWMRDLSATLPFTPGRFAAGARFAFRDTAVHAPPVTGLDESQDELASAAKAQLRILPHGLRGGAIWPLESANFCRQLRLRPDSRGGTIEKIALSPGGGDADQRAEFLNGKLAIISETRNGYVQRHRVEIIGRISVFWHRAKHVVVYERTVSPSEQFTPEGGIGTRTRRPVLRKVSEYIELLQPARSYPDFATAKAESSGFLRAMRFNSRIIYVDSAWSEDVGDYGWRIPLWDRHAAVQRPQVYPRPDIAFVTAAEGDGDAPTAAQECLDPDNIFFFADAVAENDDTDNWIPRVGIDSANLPPPSADQQPEVEVPGGTGSRKPSASRVPRGLRRFTWRLAPATKRTALNAERGAEPLFAGLDTLTFMRATSDSADGTRSQALAKDMADIRFPDPLSAINSAARNFVSTAADPGSNDQQVKGAASALQRAYSDWQGDYQRYAGPGGELEKLQKHATGLPTRCEKMVDDFVGSLQRRKLLILDRVRSWAALPDLDGLNIPAGIDHVTGQIVKKIMAQITPVLVEVTEDVGSLKTAIQSGRAIVRDFDTDIETILGQANRKLDALVESYDETKPWSSHRIDEYHQRVAAVRDGLAGDVVRNIAEVQSRFATEVDAVGQKLTRGLSARIREIEASDKSLIKALGKAEGSAAAFLATVGRRLADNQPRIAELARRIDEAIAGIADPNDPNRQALERLRGHVTDLAAAVASCRDQLATTERRLQTATDALEDAIRTTAAVLAQVMTRVRDFVTDAKAEIDALDDNVANQIKLWLTDQIAIIAQVPHDLIDLAGQLGRGPDWIVKRLREQLASASAVAASFVDECTAAIDASAVSAQKDLGTLVGALDPARVATILEKQIVRPAVADALSGLRLDEVESEVAERLAELSELVEGYLDSLDQAASADLADIRTLATQACKDLGAGLDSAVAGARAELEAALKGLKDDLSDINNALNDVARLRDIAKGFSDTVEQAGREITSAVGAADAYADRVFEAAGKVTSGGLASVPSNVLRLYAAAASAPALPNLDFQRERLAYYYNELNNYIDTTRAEAWFGRLGDELKAIGLSIPFSKIGDAIVPEGLDKLDIGKVFRNFAGIDLSKLFPGYKLPARAGDAIKVSHAFDKKLFRAWVQIDIDLPMPERKSLFALGPFSLDFVDSHMTGFVRLEASKDSDRVEQSGSASLITNVDAVVSGQSMVMLQKVGVGYERGSGLKVDFDPKNLRLNPAFKFIQDTLGTLFPDDIGGLKVIKQNGIPVGVEHEFSMPPVSLMFGTSGVSNITIANHFSLIAYPDFVISNRFALSSPERPFIFSIFVIGGTGYIWIDCEYRPFSSELAVTVEAAAGGSAALGFAAGPISGQVTITLSIALSYRKVIGRSGGGLNMSLVLVIAGGVDVAGIASVYLSLLLRMTYRENGQIDGLGTVSVSIRISRFYTFNVRRDVEKQLRGGGGANTLRVAARPMPGAASVASVGQRILGARG